MNLFRACQFRSGEASCKLLYSVYCTYLHGCRYHMAVIIPFRDRDSQLIALLRHLIPLLQRQTIHFRIFVVEQVFSSYDEYSLYLSLPVFKLARVAAP